MDVVAVASSSSPELLDAWHRLISAAEAAELAGLEPPSRQESSFVVDSTPRELRWGLLGVEGTEPVAGYVAEQSLDDNLDMAWGWLFVAPDHAGRGVGRQLLARAKQRHLDDGRRRIESSVRLGGRGEAFALGHGAEPTQVELCNVLNMADAPAELETLAGTVADGYELRTWQEACPDDLVEAYAAAHDAMNDAPHQAEREDWTWTAERVRAAEDRYRRNGMRVLVAAAVHTATGQIGGYTDLLICGRPGTAIQEDTGVVRAHRGHGLGLTLKAANLIQLRREAPAVRTVMTWNAESNAHMLAVNSRLGFRAHSRWQELELSI